MSPAAITWNLNEVTDRVVVDETTGCWNWAKAIHPTGYATVKRGGISQVAHRFVYELLVGPISEGLELDHRCHTDDQTCAGGKTCKHRSCVNPAHLEPVDPLTNYQRGRAFVVNTTKTECPQGHPYEGRNLIKYRGRRYCRACTYARRTAARAS